MITKLKEKTKNIWKKHKVKICIVGGVIVVGAIAYLVLKDGQLAKRFIPKGFRAIAWQPKAPPADLPKVKEFLEVNKDNVSSFAIFREGPNPAEYNVIGLTDDIVVPWGA